jgi:hypothetical protein
MPRRKLNNETREDYHFEQRLPLIAEIFDMNKEAAEKRARDSAERKVDKEDELIWAWYRDPQTNLTQLEARDRAQSTRYPEKYQLGQSAVSRKIGRLDNDVLTEPLFHLSMEQIAEDDRNENERVGFLPRREYQDLKRWRFTGYLDALRQSLAKFMCDMHALSTFSDGEIRTPEWAVERFSELNPNIGRELYTKMDFAIDVHEKQPKTQKDAD